MDAAGARVLIVDDEPQIRRLLSLALGRRGYVSESAADGESAISCLVASAFDLVLLDLGLPDAEGLDLCREIRSWSDIPIIVISVRAQDREKVAALDAGADDYITKPFSIEELFARIRANLRRATGEKKEIVIELGSLTVDLARRIVAKNAEPIHLTPTEYDLLKALASNAGRVITHRQLLREVRGPAYEEETPLLRVHMAALRQKLSLEPGAPGYITTEPGVGYRLTDA
jgi:two-component system, OmpR family, KDP operon response regulator KdpE